MGTGKEKELSFVSARSREDLRDAFDRLIRKYEAEYIAEVEAANKAFFESITKPKKTRTPKNPFSEQKPFWKGLRKYSDRH